MKSRSSVSTNSTAPTAATEEGCTCYVRVPCPHIFEQQFQNLQAHAFVMEAAGRINGLDEIFEQTRRRQEDKGVTEERTNELSPCPFASVTAEEPPHCAARA
jgi:hypothetical protein